MSSLRHVGIVTGMRFERALLQRWSGALGVQMPPVTCAAADPDRAADQANALAERGVRGLISFGVAGGLHPDLKPGALMIPTHVIADDGVSIPCDIAWREALASLIGALMSINSDNLVSTTQVVSTVAGKNALRRSSQAAAVDMESAAVAGVATRHNLPFIAIRAIADPADQAIPRTALAATTADGSVSLARAAAAFMRQPGDIPALARLGRATGRARKTLARVAHRGLPLFALP